MPKGQGQARLEAGPDRDALLLQLLEDRVPIAAIAKRFGVTKQAIRMNPTKRRDSMLAALYRRCMAGDPNWLAVEERSREELVRCVLAELRAALGRQQRPSKAKRDAIRRAIRLWEVQESAGPRAQEIVQRESPPKGPARRRAA